MLCYKAAYRTKCSEETVCVYGVIPEPVHGGKDLNRSITLPIVIWEKAVSPPSVQTNPFLAAAHFRSTVFAAWRHMHAHLIHDSLDPTQLTTPNDSSIGSAVFARSMPHAPTLHCTAPFPSKIDFSCCHRGIRTPIYYMVPLVTSLIELAVSLQYTLVTNGHGLPDGKTTELNRYQQATYTLYMCDAA